MDGKKGIFITYGIEAARDHSGVGLKIRNQIKIFNQLGFDFTELMLPYGNQHLIRFLYRLPFYNGYPIWKYKDELSKVDYIYMRRPFVMTCFMRKTLAKVRKVNPDIKIVLEIPTYPYDLELAHYKCSTLILLKDKYNRRRLKGVVDRIVTLTEDEKIFNIPTIRIKNGIIVDDVFPRIPSKKPDNIINLCAIALFKEWHAYERILLGMAEYYANGGSRDIVIHMVGEGTELPLYKKIVKENKLDKNVRFYGYLEGAELDAVYNVAEIGICSLGCHRKGIHLSSELKSREYMAKGLPMVSSTPIDVIDSKAFPYCLYVPENDMPVKMEDIINFYDFIYQDVDQEDVIKKIREFAYNTVDMKQTMASVVNFFKSGK